MHTAHLFARQRESRLLLIAPNPKIEEEDRNRRTPQIRWGPQIIERRRLKETKSRARVAQEKLKSRTLSYATVTRLDQKQKD